MDTFENLNIVLMQTPTQTPTDADANTWVWQHKFSGDIVPAS